MTLLLHQSKLQLPERGDKEAEKLLSAPHVIVFVMQQRDAIMTSLCVLGMWTDRRSLVCHVNGGWRGYFVKLGPRRLPEWAAGIFNISPLAFFIIFGRHTWADVGVCFLSFFFFRSLFSAVFFFLEWCFIEGEQKSLLFGAQDVQIEREKQIYSVTGGCTALTVVYLLGKLYVANAGDSRCVLQPSSEQTQTSAPVWFKNIFLPFLEARSASSSSCLIS